MHIPFNVSDFDLFLLFASLIFNLLFHIDYFPLGDLTSNESYPTKTAMMVIDNKDGLVAKPKSIS